MEFSAATVNISKKQRKQLKSDALFLQLRRKFNLIEDPKGANIEISLTDALMSGFAMFSLKDPSLLAFDRRRIAEEPNLKSIYGINRIPCDSQMRARLDEVNPDALRSAYNAVFRAAQRGKILEKYVYLDSCYLVSLDGTGYFSSKKLSSPYCLQKENSKTGEKTYHLQMLGSVIVHPDFKEVIPLPPEPICKQDGQTKNDCERNAARRWLTKFREDHPKLNAIVVEDGLSSNAPHIRNLLDHNCHFILGVKEGDHAWLMAALNQALSEGRYDSHQMLDPARPHIHHSFQYFHGISLNQSNQDVVINVLRYWEYDEKLDEQIYFCWVTDLSINTDNVSKIMRAGRARWKVENETFNTLKNQGYHLEHNYGLGKNNLSMVFVSLMMLAFLIDQIQQISCPLFRAILDKAGCKRDLFENIRSIFRFFIVSSMSMLYQVILNGPIDYFAVPIEDDT
jgi:hypothetical protein